MQLVLCKNIRSAIRFSSKLPRRKQIRRYAQAFETENDSFSSLKQQMMRPDARMKWAQGGKEGGGWAAYGEDALRIMYDKNLLENRHSLTDVDFKVLKSVVRLLKLGYLDARDIETQSSEAFQEMLEEENSLDSALEQLTLAQSTELKWTQPLPSIVYKIFHKKGKLKTQSDQLEEWLDLSDFVKSWNEEVSANPELGLEPFRTQSQNDAKENLIHLGLCSRQEGRREGLITWRKIIPQNQRKTNPRDAPLSTYKVLLTELPPRKLVSAIETDNQELLHTFRVQALENMYDHRELRHLAIVLTKHVRDGMSRQSGTQIKFTAEERFEGLQPVVKMLLQCFDVHDAKALKQFRESEHKYVLEDANHPYITQKSKLGKEAGKILKKLFKDQFNTWGERSSFSKAGLRDDELNDIRSSGVFDEEAAVRAEYQWQQSEPKDYFKTILDETKVKPNFLDGDFDSVVKDSLSDQFESQFRDGYMYTIRSRFKACPYTIPSFPVAEAKEIEISPWNVRYLSKFVNERGMVLPRRVTGVSIHAQLAITKAITKAKILRIMPTDKKFMFVDNRGLKKAQWVRMSTKERIANEPKIPSLTRAEAEENFGFPTYSFEEMEEKLEEIGMKFGLDTSKETGSPYDDLSHKDKQKILKTDPDSFPDDGELPKTTDIDEIYSLKDEEPEVQMHQMARQWRAKPRKDLQEQFKKKYVNLSQYWKELYAKKEIES